MGMISTSVLAVAITENSGVFNFKIPQPNNISDDWDNDGDPNITDPDDDNDGEPDVSDSEPFGPVNGGVLTGPQLTISDLIEKGNDHIVYVNKDGEVIRVDSVTGEFITHEISYNYTGKIKDIGTSYQGNYSAILTDSNKVYRLNLDTPTNHGEVVWDRGLYGDPVSLIKTYYQTWVLTTNDYVVKTQNGAGYPIRTETLLFKDSWMHVDLASNSNVPVVMYSDSNDDLIVETSGIKVNWSTLLGVNSKPVKVDWGYDYGSVLFENGQVAFGKQASPVLLPTWEGNITDLEMGTRYLAGFGGGNLFLTSIGGSTVPTTTANTPLTGIDFFSASSYGIFIKYTNGDIFDTNKVGQKFEKNLYSIE